MNDHDRARDVAEEKDDFELRRAIKSAKVVLRRARHFHGPDSTEAHAAKSALARAEYDRDRVLEQRRMQRQLANARERARRPGVDEAEGRRGQLQRDLAVRNQSILSARGGGRETTQ